MVRQASWERWGEALRASGNSKLERKIIFSTLRICLGWIEAEKNSRRKWQRGKVNFFSHNNDIMNTNVDFHSFLFFFLSVSSTTLSSNNFLLWFMCQSHVFIYESGWLWLVCGLDDVQPTTIPLIFHKAWPIMPDGFVPPCRTQPTSGNSRGDSVWTQWRHNYRVAHIVL